MMFLLLLMIIPYLVIGAFVARNDYARRLASAGGPEVANKLANLRKQFNEVKHTNGCWRGSVYRSKDNDCDCKYSGVWKSLRKQIADTENEMGGIIEGPYKMMFLYPVVGFHRFMTNGAYKPNGYDPALTARLEKELEIGS